MLGEHTPVVLLRRSTNALLEQHPHIREGAEEGFHQGRVAIRRMREVLAISGDHYEDKTIEGIEARLRRTARVLGRARDADVAQRLIHHVEARFPAAPAALTQLRSVMAAEQLSSRRRAIKEVESLDLPALPDELERAQRPRSLRSTFSTSWRSTLREHVARRADELRSAIDRAGGVYFPNRVHATRIAIKRLRYALELAKASRTWRMPRAIRVLRQAQSALGDAHDREVLTSRFEEMRTGESTHADTAPLEQFLRAEIDAFHRAYLDARPQLLAVCDAARAQARGRWTRERWLLVASSLVLPPLLLVRRASEPPHEDDRMIERRVRVTVSDS